MMVLAARGEELIVERVFGPEAPGAYKHPAAITELANGDLYLAYYGGSGEYADDTAVYGSRRAAGSTSWTDPVAIADTPFRSEGNPVVWQAPEGPVWLYYVIRYGETWSTSRIQAKVSTDGARTWTDPIVVAFREGMMVRNKPIVLRDGAHLIPVYHETGHDTERVGADSTSRFLRFDPAARTWEELGAIRSPNGNIQPAVVELADGRLVAYCRRGGGYGPREEGWIIRAESTDGGRSWTDGRDSAFPNPNAAVEFLRLRSGRLLLIFNDSMNRRTPLAAALSEDEDRSYPYRRNVMEGRGTFAYPYAVQTRDERIHLIFTSNERTVINLAAFDEAWVMGGGPATSGR